MNKDSIKNLVRLRLSSGCKPELLAESLEGLGIHPLETVAAYESFLRDNLATKAFVPRETL